MSYKQKPDPKRQLAEAINCSPTKVGGKARGRSRHVPGVMNKTEKAYSDELDRRYKAGEIQWFAFEAMKFKLADKTYYTPDFVVLRNDGMVECVEVKGFWEDDARVKIKCAAEKFFLFQFIALKPKAKKDGGGWSREEF